MGVFVCVRLSVYLGVFTCRVSVSVNEYMHLHTLSRNPCFKAVLTDSRIRVAYREMKFNSGINVRYQAMELNTK